MTVVMGRAKELVVKREEEMLAESGGGGGGRPGEAFPFQVCGKGRCSAMGHAGAVDALLHADLLRSPIVEAVRKAASLGAVAQGAAEEFSHCARLPDHHPNRRRLEFQISVCGDDVGTGLAPTSRFR